MRLNLQCTSVFRNIILIVNCFSVVILFNSANPSENSTKRMMSHSQSRVFGRKQQYKISTSKDEQNLLLNDVDIELSNVKDSNQRLYSNAGSVGPKKDGFTNATDSEDAGKQAINTSELNHRGMRQKKASGIIQTIFHNDKLKETNHLNENLSPAHRIARRSANTRNVTLTAPNPPSWNISYIFSPLHQSCSRRCTVNTTERRTGGENLSCYCDSACYEICNDCCFDYNKYCGLKAPNHTTRKEFNWTCEPCRQFRFASNQSCKIGDGFWTISRCANSWPYDEIRSKCEHAARTSNYFETIADLILHIPAVVDEKLTFRNAYCAQCNHINPARIKIFPVYVKTAVLPASIHSSIERINFLLANRAEFIQNRLWHLYCLKSSVGACPSNITVESCTGGNLTRLLSQRKPPNNFDCVLCSDPIRRWTYFASSPLFGRCLFMDTSQKFLIKIDFDFDNFLAERITFSLVTHSCESGGLIFDSVLKECVQNFAFPVRFDGMIVDAFFTTTEYSQFSETGFKSIMKQYFGVDKSKIAYVDIDAVLEDPSNHSIFYHSINLLLKLHPDQCFDLFFGVVTNSFSKNLQDFVHFKKPLRVAFNDTTYTLIKTTSHPLSFITRLIVNEFSLPRDLVKSACSMTQTGLSKNDFVIKRYLTLYQKSTGLFFVLGKYDVSENSISLCHSEIPSILTCSGEESCKGRCSNRTVWQTDDKMRCSCDPECHLVFNDCCTDYAKFCGAQTPKATLIKKYHHTCKYFGISASCKVSDRIWMVTRCPPEWSFDIFRAKCEAPLDELTYSSPELNRFLPVVGYDNVTFRNMYCALCNKIQKYTPWLFHVGTWVIPPKNYNLTEKIKFLLAHGATIRWRARSSSPRRHCVTHHFNDHLACFPSQFPPSCPYFRPQSFSLVFDQNSTDSESQTKVTVFDEACKHPGMIFDDILQVCRVNWLSPPKKNGQERFYVYVWIRPPKDAHNTFFTPIEFQDSLANYLNISRLQVFDINITRILVPVTNSPLAYLVSSTIALTPQESLALLASNRNENNNSSDSKLVNYVYFSEVFLLEIKSIHYTVIKTTSRPLACVGQKSYTSEKYILLDKERVLIPSTNQTYNQFEYYRQNLVGRGKQLGNIIVCEKYIFASCNGTIVEYTEKQYVVMANVSIIVSEISALYNYGEYEILPNKSIVICKDIRVFIITKARQTIGDNEVLGYMTFIFFLLSILFLVFLLVTYSLFPQLRTLPGKNLMSFAASLLLFQIFWLPSSFTQVRFDKPTCTALAILEHYFLMSSFVAMTVIAFHTCKVFGRNLPAPKMSADHERKLFWMYLAWVWILPAVFVAVCAVLDYQDVVTLGYGKSEVCWLTERNAYLFVVTLPIAVLLLFNIVAFVITAVFLRKHAQNQAATQASGNRGSNLSIYVKLSTLMGFTWLFGLLALAVTSTNVFWYLFVIFTPLQGVFIAVAFVLNGKTYSLYKQGFKKRSSSGVRIDQPQPKEKFQLLPKGCNDTKL